MEEWLADPVQMRFAEERQARRALNASATSRIRTRHVHVQQIDQQHSSLVVEPGSRQIEEGNSFRFPLSDDSLNLLTTQYLRNLDGGEIKFVRDTDDVLQPIADFMDDVDDGDAEPFFLEDNDGTGQDDCVSMNNVPRRLQMTSTQQTNQHNQNAVELSCSPSIQSQTALSRASITAIPTTMLARVSLVPFKPSKVIPIDSSNMTAKTSKNPFKISFWRPKSNAIANDSDPIVTNLDSDAWGSSIKSYQPTKPTSQSSFRKITRVVSRLFVKSNE